jgi:ribosomal protein S18 acetylase RimI-like enzyme
MRTHRYPYAAAIASRPDLLEVMRVRHLQGRDLRQIEELSQASHGIAPPLPRAELETWRAQPGTLGLIAECDNVILGVVLAQEQPDNMMELAALHVGPLFRRLGIGTILLGHVLAHLPAEDCDFYALIPERADACLLFLRSQGWRARAMLGELCHMQYVGREMAILN